MKNTFKKMAVMFVAATTMCFSGCSKDDSSSTSGSGNGQPSGGGTSEQTISLAGTNWKGQEHKGWLTFFGTHGYETTQLSVRFTDDRNGVVTETHHFEGASSHDFSDTYRFTYSFNGRTNEPCTMVFDNRANSKFWLDDNQRYLNLNDYGLFSYGIVNGYSVDYGTTHALVKTN